MSPKVRKFRRLIGDKRYRKLFVVRAGGHKTEPQYFGALNGLVKNAHVICLPGGHASSPSQALHHMKTYLKEEAPQFLYEAWLIIDRDQWGKEQLARLRKWEQQGDSHGLAISHPKFEYWLLLHFESGNNIKSKRECFERLKRHLPDYNKGIDPRKFTLDRIKDAVDRAKSRDNTTDEDWLPTFGSTTVYKLVERILQSK